jgi:hypothetical protein
MPLLMHVRLHVQPLRTPLAVQDGSVLKILPSTASSGSKQLQCGVTDADKVNFKAYYRYGSLCVAVYSAHYHKVS